jgi:hypothetical protein
MHRDIAFPRNMLRNAVEERVSVKIIETIKEALNAIAVEDLEQWSRMLERLTRGTDLSSMAPCGEGMMNSVGRGHLPTRGNPEGRGPA